MSLPNILHSLVKSSRSPITKKLVQNTQRIQSRKLFFITISPLISDLFSRVCQGESQNNHQNQVKIIILKNQVSKQAEFLELGTGAISVQALCYLYLPPHATFPPRLRSERRSPLFANANSVMVPALLDVEPLRLWTITSPTLHERRTKIPIERPCAHKYRIRDVGSLTCDSSRPRLQGT